MSYAQATAIDASTIPIIDIAALRSGADPRPVADAMLHAAGQVGFFYIRNHGVPNSVIDTARNAARRFFAAPLADKQRARINPHHRGFLRIGEAKMYETAKIDLKESFVWGLELAADDPLLDSNPFLVANNWPAFDPDFRRDVYPFLSACNACGKDLFRAFAVTMGLPTESFIEHFAHPISRASIVYYPPQPSELGEQQFGIAPHTDFGCLTILHQDSVGGLEVARRDGEWVTAHPIDDTLVVNVGDLLERWTNNRFRSTPHRVINKAPVPRYSLVAAIDPDFDTVVDSALACRAGEEPAYPPVTCGEYVLSRFDRSFSYRSKR